MGLISEKSERILKVYVFPVANNTLSLLITLASSSITLSREILRCWISIIINSDPLMAKHRHVLKT